MYFAILYPLQFHFFLIRYLQHIELWSELKRKKKKKRTSLGFFKREIQWDKKEVKSVSGGMDRGWEQCLGRDYTTSWYVELIGRRISYIGEWNCINVSYKKQNVSSHSIQVTKTLWKIDKDEATVECLHSYNDKHKMS